MIIPKIRPDEFGPGYLIRLGLVNGLSSEKEVIETILQTYSECKNLPNITAVYLAYVLGMTIEDYCQRHTLFPVLRCITNTDSALRHGSIENESNLRRFGHFGMIKHLKVCEWCVKEDLDFLGHAYFRRSHQSFGINYCNKHNSNGFAGLYQVSKLEFANPDQVELRKTLRFNQTQNDIIDRYHSLIDGAFDLDTPVNRNRILSFIQDKAREKKVHWADKGYRFFFSDFLIKNGERTWLTEFYRNFNSKIPLIRYSAVDAILSPSKHFVRPMHYLLLIAALYENIDQAVEMLKNSTWEFRNNAEIITR